MLPSAQTPACRTYLSLTETTCTACGCSAAAPSNSLLSSPISLSTAVLVPFRMVHGGGGGGGGGGGRSRKRCQLAYDKCSSLVELSPN